MKNSLKILVSGLAVIFLLVGCKKGSSSSEYIQTSETSTSVISASEGMPSSLVSSSSTPSLNIISLDDLNDYFSTDENASLVWTASAKELLLASNPNINPADIENEVYTVRLEKDSTSTNYSITIACGIAHSDTGRFYSGVLDYQGNGFYAASISENKYDGQDNKINTTVFPVIFLLEKHGEETLKDAMDLTMQSYSEDAGEDFNSLYHPTLNKKIEFVSSDIYAKEHGYF